MMKNFTTDDGPQHGERSGDGLPQEGAETYLGDGLYASFDGWQISLRTEDGDNFVVLEPPVWRNLREWLQRYPRLLLHMEEHQR